MVRSSEEYLAWRYRFKQAWGRAQSIMRSGKNAEGHRSAAEHAREKLRGTVDYAVRLNKRRGHWAEVLRPESGKEPEWQRDYPRYLASRAWQFVRERAFKEQGRVCALCLSTKELQVDHLCYDTVGDEDPVADVWILCRACHKQETKRRGQGRRYKYARIVPWDMRPEHDKSEQYFDDEGEDDA